jgi:hypothetical protein
MRFTSPLLKQIKYSSSEWRDSQNVPGVRYTFRKISLGQRIDLTRRVRELCLRDEFLKAGDAGEKLESILSDLIIKKLYLEWAAVKVEGLRIDGQQPTVDLLVDRGPEALTDEIIEEITVELGLTEAERKNS